MMQGDGVVEQFPQYLLAAPTFVPEADCLDYLTSVRPYAQTEAGCIELDHLLSLRMFVKS